MSGSLIKAFLDLISGVLMGSKLVENIFSYEQAIKYLEDYWYWNPQEISCFESKYFEIAEFELRLPSSPKEHYCENVSFFAYSTMFGEKFFTYNESLEYCSKMYNELPEDKRTKNLNDFYHELRSLESRLVRNPNAIFKDKGWISIRDMFGIEDAFPIFTHVQAVEYCSAKLNELDQVNRPVRLMDFYKKLRVTEPRLPSNPIKYFKDNGWSSIRSLFGIEAIVHFTYDEAVRYCITKYRDISDGNKPTSLQSFYKELRVAEPRLPPSPYQSYKDSGWLSMKVMFGIDEVSKFNYEQASEYCTEKYNELSDEEKPTSLHSFYNELRDLEPKLKSSPSMYIGDKPLVSIRVFFGLTDLVLFTYREAVEYCSEKYHCIQYDKKPTALQSFYRELSYLEPRLPSNPDKYYRDQVCTSILGMFGLEEKIFFTYDEAMAYCSGKYRELPDKKKPTNLNAFYQKLRAVEERLPSGPNVFFKNDGWVSFRVLFGLEEKVLFTYREAVEYCADRYRRLPDSEKLSNLYFLYKKLRQLEPRLPSTPTNTYKNRGWTSYRRLFGLNDFVLFKYEEAAQFCIRRFNALPQDRKPSNLRSFYQELRTVEPRLPRNPDHSFKDKGWISIKAMFGLSV